MSDLLIRQQYTESQRLLKKARRLIPGGHHLSGRPLVEHGPMYMRRGRGCRVWDVDGNEFIDYQMAFGPFLLGYTRDEVDQAAFEQVRQGHLLSLNHPLHVTFIERLVRWAPGAEMGLFFKTGSEATTAALRLARRHTRRRKVARCGYHGWHDWCIPLEDYVPEGLDEQVLPYEAAQPATLESLLKAQDGQVAAVILSPEMVCNPQPVIFQELQRLTHQAGAVFIMDEIKTGFRTKPGTISQYLGVTPDLLTLSKALGNGWPVAAVVGKGEIMRRGEGMHYSATFHGETAGLAAALAVLDILEREPVTQHVWQLGQSLIDGLNRLAERHGVPAEAYGEPLPPMPFFAFRHPDSEVNLRLRESFYGGMLARGVLMHPRHMWFISYAHSEADIQTTLEAADQVLGSLAV